MFKIVRQAIVAILCATLLIARALASNAPVATTASLPTPSVSWLPAETQSQHDQRMAWWRAAKFGMFIHWGLYAIPARGEWYMRSSQMNFAQYSAYASQFDPVNFNANQWVALARDAGIKYMVLTTKHHDGFAMFKSDASAYNIVDATPFKRDVVKELSEACAKKGIRFGTYYSFITDWGHKGGGSSTPQWDPALQGGDFHTYIDDLALPQVKELLTNYGPISVMWFDSDGAQGISPEESAETAALLRTQPQIIVDDRVPGVKPDFATAEVDVPLNHPVGDWELCGSVKSSWGYTASPVKPIDVLLPYIVSAWGKGGNVLLNVGPTADGVIDPASTNVLQQIGTWMHTYGDTIYDSSAGPFDYLPWGTATRKRDILYLQIFNWPADGILTVPLSNTVTKASLLGPMRPTPLVVSPDGPDRLIVHLPVNAPDPNVNVVALTVRGEPQTDYRSVLLNAPVVASSSQSSAAYVDDDSDSTSWQSTQAPGWLEFDLPHQVTVNSFRMSAAYTVLNDFTFEYKQGNNWIPILADGHTELHQYSVVQSFAPVTASVFRLRVIAADAPFRIKDVELYPPL